MEFRLDDDGDDIVENITSLYGQDESYRSGITLCGAAVVSFPHDVIKNVETMRQVAELLGFKKSLLIFE
ncbi:hypothetical protein AVEN_59707-1, partial [Araneus ventricosus]